MTGEAVGAQILHAGCIAHQGRGIVICGPSGAGKSSLALRMLALGAGLVCDDRTEIRRDGNALVAHCPAPAIAGLIEARGIGILRVPPVESVRLALAVDLGRDETERLPPRRHVTWLGIDLPLVLRPQNPHLAEALLIYLAGGRQE